jgi:thiamine-phosphate pyrophosphorylase
MHSDRQTLRILDAALNRATEGLRVIEDYVRFVRDDGHLTGAIKRLRHDLAAVAGRIPAAERHAARDTAHDVGTAISTPAEGLRDDAWAVCQANLERAKQSLRSLEEFGKLAGPELGAAFESLRYRLYSLEAAIGRTVDAAARLADVRLCVLIDCRASEEEFQALVGELILARVGMIQLRDKHAPVRQLVERARTLMRLALVSPGFRPLVIINDRPAVAAAVDADGVQLGQDDFLVKDARAVVGPRKLIGVSTHSITQARQAVLEGANFIGVGPTFPTTTKQFDVFPGLGLLRAVASEIRLPAFAIGGIDAAKIADVLATGMSRIAVCGAVASAPSPLAAAQELNAQLCAAAVASPPEQRV